jgi:predicted hotdog family 3-hydroxylacyl-ACP dehydratase
MKPWPAVATLVPQAGSMCLLERIVAVDAARIVCVTGTHRELTNPLRRADRLSALCLAEYGAQAMAVHGSLLHGAAGTPPRAGLLVSIRDLALHVDWLDDIGAELRVEAWTMLAQDTGSIYEFEASAGARVLGRGRVQVLFAR